MLYLKLIFLGAENEENSVQMREVGNMEIREIRDARNKHDNRDQREKTKPENEKKKNKLRGQNLDHKKQNKPIGEDTEENKKEKKSEKNKRKKSLDKKKKYSDNKNEDIKEKHKNALNLKRAKSLKEEQNSGSVRQTCPVSDACVATAVSYLKIVQNQAANFINQKSRIERQNTTGSRKNDKKDVFSDALNRLVDFAGGNKSAPACGSLKTGPGVDQIKNKTSTLTDCSAKIKAACDITALPQPNTTFVSGKC